MITELLAVCTLSVPSAVGAAGVGAAVVATPHAFGIKQAAAVIVIISALSLAAMILVGHLRASLKQNRADKDH